MPSDRYEITYTDAHTGQKKVHTFVGSQGGAKDWGDVLSRENGDCPTKVEYVEGFTEKRTHVGGVGDVG